MNIYIMLAIIIANIIGISIVYQFIKRLDKKEKIIFIAISVAIVYILVSFVYWISGFGIDEKVHEQSKDFITYLFVPVNVILFIPYIAAGYIKYKGQKIKAEELVKRVFRVIIIAIFVLIAEYFYFKNIQLNIKQIGEDTQNTEIINVNTNIEINDILNVLNNDETNTTITNTISNTTITNTTR